MHVEPTPILPSQQLHSGKEQTNLTWTSKKVAKIAEPWDMGSAVWVRRTVATDCFWMSSYREKVRGTPGPHVLLMKKTDSSKCSCSPNSWQLQPSTQRLRQEDLIAWAGITRSSTEGRAAGCSSKEMSSLPISEDSKTLNPTTNDDGVSSHKS